MKSKLKVINVLTVFIFLCTILFSTVLQQNAYADTSDNTVILHPGSNAGIAGNVTISGLNHLHNYTVQIMSEGNNQNKYVDRDGNTSSNVVIINGVASVGGLVNGTTYLVKDVTLKAYPPIANIPGGAVAVGTQVRLSSSTQGAEIYYTTDGTNPSQYSTLYTAPITINKTTTIKAIAVISGLIDSDLMTVTYTIAQKHTKNKIDLPKNAKLVEGNIIISCEKEEVTDEEGTPLLTFTFSDKNLDKIIAVAQKNNEKVIVFQGDSSDQLQKMDVPKAVITEIKEAGLGVEFRAGDIQYALSNEALSKYCDNGNTGDLTVKINPTMDEERRKAAILALKRSVNELNGLPSKEEMEKSKQENPRTYIVGGEAAVTSQRNQGLVALGGSSRYQTAIQTQVIGSVTDIKSNAGADVNCRVTLPLSDRDNIAKLYANLFLGYSNQSAGNPQPGTVSQKPGASQTSGSSFQTSVGVTGQQGVSAGIGITPNSGAQTATSIAMVAVHDNGSVEISPISDMKINGDKLQLSGKFNGNSSFAIVAITPKPNGWDNEAGVWAYIKDGNLLKGWNQIDGAWYLMDSLGVMQTGWQQSNNVRYYLNDNGTMKTGWFKDKNEKWYYFYSDESMANNTEIDGYKLTENGDMV